MTRHRHRHSKRKRHGRSRKNIIRKTLEQSVDIAKSTSKKYMPKVKSGLENVGDKVINTSKKSVPFLQKLTRKFFGSITKSSTSKKHRH